MPSCPQRRGWQGPITSNSSVPHGAPARRHGGVQPPPPPSRGAAMPKSRRSAAAVARAVPTGWRPIVTPSNARRNETWIVTGTTRSCGQASIITGVPPVNSPRNSVCPRMREARLAYSTALLIGLVTTPPALARLHQAHRPLDAGDDCRWRSPDRAGQAARSPAVRHRANTGSAAPNTSATWSGDLDHRHRHIQRADPERIGDDREPLAPCPPASRHALAVQFLRQCRPGRPW